MRQSEDSLAEIRKIIDTVDDQIIPLLQQRFHLIAQLKPYKTSLTDRKREAEILSKISSHWVRAVYRNMFRVAKRFLSSD